ncbi:MAG: hypothetical protein ACFFCO_05240 [Promethearchaeota archaeon]
MVSKRVVRRGVRASLLDRVRNNPRDTRVYSVSKRKVQIWLGKQGIVLRESDPLVAQIRRIRTEDRDQQIAAAKSGHLISEAAERKALALLHEIVRRHDCLHIENDEVIVQGRNGGQYAITIEGGYVYQLCGKKRQYVCVFVKNWYKGRFLPLADCIIAKALTIAYAPHLINTL